MSIYVDRLINVDFRGRNQWCHMLSEDFDELHAFAKTLGLKKQWFQGNHYDLTAKMRTKAISLGAIELQTRREFCALMDKIRAQISG